MVQDEKVTIDLYRLISAGLEKLGEKVRARQSAVRNALQAIPSERNTRPFHCVPAATDRPFLSINVFFSTHLAGAA